jgi:cellobiose phosphorylase
MPAEWQSYTLDYRYGDTLYHIDISQTFIASGASTQRLSLDGVEQDEESIALVDDGSTHRVEVILSTVASAAP